MGPYTMKCCPLLEAKDALITELRMENAEIAALREEVDRLREINRHLQRQIRRDNPPEVEK